MTKPEATWHPRTKAPWICRWCGFASPTDQLNLEYHEPKCDLRVEGK